MSIKLTFVPLWLAYVVFPLSNLLADYLEIQLWRNWIDVAWILLSVLIMVFRHSNFKIFSHKLVLIGFFMLVFVGIIVAVIAIAVGEVPAVSAAMEVKPLIYLIVVAILVGNSVIPSPQQFCRAGIILSIILVAEMVLRSLLAGELMRPLGSGEVNYDAALILLSLVFALARRDLAIHYAPILFLGLLAAFSRTCLVAACLVLIMARTVPVYLKIIAICAALIGVIQSFLMRDLELTSLDGMDRYWMWAVGVEYLATNWSSWFINFAPGSSIYVNAPPFVADLWLSQQEKLALVGIFPFHFHALWMRLPLAWGWAPFIILLLILVRMLFISRNMSLESRAYASTCLVLGLTMGLFYLSNVGVPYLLAWAYIYGQFKVHKRQLNIFFVEKLK